MSALARSILPRPDDSAGDWRTTLDIQTHRDRVGMPTAWGQALEECAFGGLVVHVKGLRIELIRERLDLFFVKRVGLVAKRCPTNKSSR